MWVWALLSESYRYERPGPIKVTPFSFDRRIDVQNVGGRQAGRGSTRGARVVRE